ncbi:uncharacterized protein C3orf62 homolog isoform X2 [Pseudophryne corroboree]
MSEKLIKCRTELLDAIDRALEGCLCPVSSHLQICQSCLSHVLDGSGPIESPPGSPAVLHQPLESVRLIPTEGHIADGVCSLHPSIQKPFSSIEIVLQLRRGSSPDQHSEELQSLLHDAENLPRDPSPQDVTRDLLALIENTRSPVLQEISRSLEWTSDIFCLPEEDLPLTPPPAGGAAEPVPDDEQMVEMVLDLEEDYPHRKSCLIL